MLISMVSRGWARGAARRRAILVPGVTLQHQRCQPLSANALEEPFRVLIGHTVPFIIMFGGREPRAPRNNTDHDQQHHATHAVLFWIPLPQLKDGDMVTISRALRALKVNYAFLSSSAWYLWCPHKTARRARGDDSYRHDDPTTGRAARGAAHTRRGGPEGGERSCGKGSGFEVGLVGGAICKVSAILVESCRQPSMV